MLSLCSEVSYLQSHKHDAWGLEFHPWPKKKSQPSSLSLFGVFLGFLSGSIITVPKVKNSRASGNKAPSTGASSMDWMLYWGTKILEGAGGWPVMGICRRALEPQRKSRPLWLERNCFFYHKALCWVCGHGYASLLQDAPPGHADLVSDPWTKEKKFFYNMGQRRGFHQGPLTLPTWWLCEPKISAFAFKKHTFCSPRPQVPYLQVQPTADLKYLEKQFCDVCTEYVSSFFS